MKTFTMRDADKFHTEDVNGIHTVIMDGYFWIEEEQRRGTEADIEAAYIACDGVGYAVKARKPYDPAGLTPDFMFGQVTHITKEGAMVVTCTLGEKEGQTQVLSPHDFHLAYKID